MKNDKQSISTLMNEQNDIFAMSKYIKKKIKLELFKYVYKSARTNKY